MREQTLLEENSAYENAISICESKIEEKRNEAGSLLRKLKVSNQTMDIFLFKYRWWFFSCPVVLFRYDCWSCYHFGALSDIIWFAGARKCGGKLEN